ncbi:MAG: energy transducer TonB, partial [bacterium]
EATTNNQQLTTSDLDSPISNFQFPISTLDSRISNPESVAVTAYAGESLPAGILGQGNEANAGLVYIPPTTIKLPRPAYPIVSRRKGEDGTVTLSFLVYSDGTVGGISVVRSSGYPRLDKAASKSLRSAVFRPPSEKGLPVNSSRKIAFSFRLKD